MRFFALVSLVLRTAGLSAQNNITISGRVTNESGKPIAGASIVLVGTAIGTVSDEEGRYSLSCPRSGSIELLFTHSRCEPQILRIASAKDGEVRNVVLRESAKQLEEVLVRAESEAGRARNQPLSVSVLETKNISSKAISNADLLGAISGVNVRQGGGLGSDVNISINGMSGRQIRFFLDGIPLEHYSGELNMGSLPAVFFDRFEIYKGAVPATLAADALGGAVNMVSRNDGRNVADLTYGAGSFNTHKLILGTRHAVGRQGGYFSFNGFASHSDNSYTIDAEILDRDGNSRFGKVKRFHNAFGNFMARPELGVKDRSWADHAFLSLYVSGNRNEPQHNVMATQPYGDLLSRNSSFGTLLRYKKRRLAKRLDLEAYAVANFARPRLIDTSLNVYNWAGEVVARMNTGGEISASGNDLYLRDRTLSGQANATWHFSPHVGLSGTVQRSAFHREGKDDFMARYYTRDYYASPQSADRTIGGLSLKVVLLDERFTSVTTAKYFDFRAQGFSRGSAGLVEASSQKEKIGFGQALSYKFGNGLSVKSSYEHAARLPSTFELFGDQMTVLANLALRPETSHNINAGLLYRSAKTTVEIGGFYRRTDDVIWQRPGSNNSQHQNLSKSLSKGVEGEIGYRLLESLRLGLNATYQDIRSRSDLDGDERYYGKRIPNIPYFFGNADIRYAHGKPMWDRLKWNAWGGMRYVDEFFLFWEGDGRRETKNIIPKQYSANMGISLAEKDGRYSLSLECRNVFDRKLYDNFSVQRPGRAFYATLNYKM